MIQKGENIVITFEANPHDRDWLKTLRLFPTPPHQATHQLLAMIDFGYTLQRLCNVLEQAHTSTKIE